MNRRSLMALGVAALGAPALPSPVMGAEPGDIRLGSLRLHVARAAGPRGAGVLIQPTIMGLGAGMRRFAAQFAAAGITGVVWDPYDGEDAAGGTLPMLMRSKRLTDDVVVRDLNRVTDHMQRQLGLTAIAAIGWCMGGRTALLHAGQDSRIRAVAAYNPTIYARERVPLEGQMMGRPDFPGMTMDEFALAAAIKGPVQVCRPGHDLTRGVEYDALIKALSSRPDPLLYELYPEAEHGFAYTPGKAANEAAARLAWASTLALFRTQLGGSA